MNIRTRRPPLMTSTPRNPYVWLWVASCATTLACNASTEPSPADQKIAFWSVRSGHYEIYVMNGDGSGVTPLTTDTAIRSEEHTSELQSHSDLVCRLLLEKKK